MGDEPLYTFKQDGDWHTKTANETLRRHPPVAKGLLHYGLKKGDGVAFMCRTSYDWDVFDAAVMACGGVLADLRYRFRRADPQYRQLIPMRVC